VSFGGVGINVTELITHRVFFRQSARTEGRPSVFPFARVHTGLRPPPITTLL
jgi:hypothetical protein